MEGSSGGGDDVGGGDYVGGDDGCCGDGGDYDGGDDGSSDCDHLVKTQAGNGVTSCGD